MLVKQKSKLTVYLIIEQSKRKEYLNDSFAVLSFEDGEKQLTVLMESYTSTVSWVPISQTLIFRLDFPMSFPPLSETL